MIARYVAGALLLYALLTRERLPYVIAWYQRVNDGPWELIGADINEPEKAWLDFIIPSEILEDPPDTFSITVAASRIERRRGL